MDWSGLQTWLSTAPLWLISFSLLAALCVAGAAGVVLRSRVERRGVSPPQEGEGYTVSAILGLLALLLGFTFSLAVDRYEARRSLVLAEANAIGTAYLRAQLLPEPHRSRMSDLLVRYTDNRVALAKLPPGPAQTRLLARNDVLLVDIWSATSAAVDEIKSLPLSGTYIDSVNKLIDLDLSRKAARMARVPAEVFAVLMIYMVGTAGVMGYALKGRQSRAVGLLLLLLFTLALMLIVDIDRPTSGGIVESQAPMEVLQATIKAQPRQVFDRWRQLSPAPPR